MEEQERKIESLRMRLQSERSISKIARKKADQLARRVNIKFPFLLVSLRLLDFHLTNLLMLLTVTNIWPS